MSKKIGHRGPDWSGIFSSDKVIFPHERLASVDLQSGGRPLYSQDRQLVLAVNGEIYNHRDLKKDLPDYPFLTHFEREVILALYRKKGIHFIQDLNGIFVFALCDQQEDCCLIARDHMGIILLCMGWDANDRFYIASELKSLEGVCDRIQEFLPEHYLYSKDGQQLQRWYQRDWMSYEHVKDNPSDISRLRETLKPLLTGS